MKVKVGEFYMYEGLYTTGVIVYLGKKKNWAGRLAECYIPLYWKTSGFSFDINLKKLKPIASRTIDSKLKKLFSDELKLTLIEEYSKII